MRRRIADLERVFRVEPEQVQGAQDSMKSSPSPYLNVTRPQSISRGIEHDLLVLDVYAFDGSDPLGEVEHLWLGEGLGCVPATLSLPDQWRVQALLDRRPDRKGRSECMALDDDVRAVANRDLVDRGEKVVGGVAGEDVGQARLDSDPTRASKPADCQRSCSENWRSPSFTPGSSNGRSGMWLR